MILIRNQENLKRYLFVTCVENTLKTMMILFIKKISKGDERFHHKHCYTFYNRLVSVYGKDFSQMGLDEINWGARLGNLVQVSLFDIKRTKFSSSEVVSDFSIFKRRLLDEVFETKDELQMVCSST